MAKGKIKLLQIARGDELAALLDSIDDRLNTAYESIQTRIDALENMYKVYVERFELTEEPQTRFTLTNVPNFNGCKLWVNGIMYPEVDGSLTVDRENKIVTFNADKVGFELTTENVEYILIEYQTGTFIEIEGSTTHIYHLPEVPTVEAITYRVGDLVFNSRALETGDPQGWVCVKTGKGAAAEWQVFGIVNFEETVQFVDE